MGGYSKIKDINTITNNDPKSPSKSDPKKELAEPIPAEDPIKEEDTHKKKSSLQKEEEEEGENGKGKLRRNSSTASNRFMRLDRQNSSSKSLQGALRRAFSVRSSASDKYSRIYSDRPVALASPFEEDEEDEARSDKKTDKEKKHKRSKIFRACKRILGL